MARSPLSLSLDDDALLRYIWDLFGLVVKATFNYYKYWIY